MRHLKKRNKIAKTRNQRKAIYRAMAANLILKEKIITTEARAKKIKPFIEKIISRSKQNTLVNRRYLLRFFSKKVVDKLLKEIGVRYQQRPGGYLRIVKIGVRKNDATKMVILEMIK